MGKADTQFSQPFRRDAFGEAGSPIRDYLWGVMIMRMGIFTVFGYWSLIAG